MRGSTIALNSVESVDAKTPQNSEGSASSSEDRKENTEKNPAKKKEEFSELKISDIKIENQFRKSFGDIDALAANISVRGLLHPIVVTKDSRLVAGRRRLEACKKLGWEKIPVHINDMEFLAEGQLDENQYRKDFTYREAIAIKSEIEKTRVSHRPQKLKGKRGNLPPFSKGKSRDIAGKISGKSPRNISKAEKVIRAADSDPVKFSQVAHDMDSGRISVDQAYKMVTNLQRTTQSTFDEREKFDVVFFDPFWSDTTSPSNGTRSNQEDHTLTGVKSIRSGLVPIAESASLFLCSPISNLKASMKAMEQIGFDYVSNFALLASSKQNCDFASPNHEILLQGTRGNFAPPQNKPSSIISAEPGGDHSDLTPVHEMIEKTYKGRKLLLLGSMKRQGWETLNLQQIGGV